MIFVELDKVYPSAEKLVAVKAASRVAAKDNTLYDFSEYACNFSKDFMGWANLATDPPVALSEIQELANKFIDAGFESAVLLGQGGSTQAAMTLTKYCKDESTGLKFRTLDSDSPVRFREMLAAIDPAKTVVIVSSKSGGTLEMRSYLAAVRAAFLESMTEEEFKTQHLVAISDPGSALTEEATSEGWAGYLPGEATVGGRFSALSVFGLFPAALVGIDLEDLMAHAAEAERVCSQDSLDNPALQLAAFLYDNYAVGRNKFSYLTAKRGRVLGLWIEQLIAESTGKDGKGILPQIEVDSLLLAKDRGDRAVVVYRTKADTWDEAENFEQGLACVDPAIPRATMRVGEVEELAEHFMVWEYATAMCGYLMEVSPFDQPDVASTKAKVLEILDEGLPEPSFADDLVAAGVNRGAVEVTLSDCCEDAKTLREALKALFASVKPGDYFATNAFLPFTGEGRPDALADIRRVIGEKLGVMSCLEIGPRYLHSTGQLQKAGPAIGVYLVVSAGELNDIPIEGEKAPSLGLLAKAQAAGDAATLVERGRRCLHLHLSDNSGTTLRVLAILIDEVLDEL